MGADCDIGSFAESVSSDELRDYAANAADCEKHPTKTTRIRYKLGFFTTTESDSIIDTD
jgi:hypothetical protein